MISLALATALAQDWPQFRGPDGQGHSAVKRLPLKWSDTSANIMWRTKIDGLGWSSPVIAGDRLWLTTAADDGTSLRALCLEVKSGRSLHDVEVFRRAAAGKIHRKNSHASPTPILDGDRVYVHFGSTGTACLSSAGEILWTQQLRYEPVHGPGGSPALDGGLLFINCDGSSGPHVVALDTATGQRLWKMTRPANAFEKKFSFSTPLVIEVGGQKQVVSPGAGGVTAYAPEDGAELWHLPYEGGYSVVPRPVSAHGLVFLGSGFDKPELLAIQPGDPARVIWKLQKNAPLTPSPLVVGDELYVVSDDGIASCLDARTGALHWRERIGGTFSASPLHGAGRIYLLDEKGTATVIRPGKAFERLATNAIEGRTFASPVPIEGALFLRTDSELLRIEAN